MNSRARPVLPSLMPLLGAAALSACLLGPAPSAFADGGGVVLWMSVPPAVRNTVNANSPDGSSVGKVERKVISGQELYDVHLKLAGNGGEKVIELDQRGVIQGAPPPASAPVEEPKPAETPAAPPPKPEKTGLEGYGTGPADGNAEDEYQAGQHSEYGSGGERKDYSEAVKWYTKAAADGSAGAAFSLASMYADGLGVKVDNAMAAGWYQKAAERSHADAQYNLGQAYVKGLGVPQDYGTAWFWFSLAANNRNANAVAARDAAAAHLTPEQLAAAKKRLQDWKPVAAAAVPAAAPAAPAAVGITPPPVSDVMPQITRPHPAIAPPAATGTKAP